MSELNPQTMNGRQWDFCALAGILLLGIMTYAHTLHVPWYLDDIRAIVENPAVHSLRGALQEIFEVKRGAANLTFAVNYWIGGTEVVGYHLVNIAIHLATSFLVFLLLKRVFPDRMLLALIGALIFVAHPLQTQAVTYTVQRMTSLAALFFLLALYLYVQFRETSAGRRARRWLFYSSALLCGALAVLVKQNTAVLPVAILLFDRYFLCRVKDPVWRRQIGYAAPFALAPLWLAVEALLVPVFSTGGVSNVGGMPDLVHLRNLSPINYLVTEFSVIWHYLRLLFIPYGQALDYDVPIVATIWSWKNLFAFAGIAALLAAATCWRKRLPLVSAGIFWFFLCLAVESTFIPLDPVFEHRLYLPMVGFILVVLAGFSRLSRRATVVVGTFLVGVLAVLTWQRNQLWNDPIAFYQDNLQRAPRSERVHVELANAYRKQGRRAEAIPLYQQALAINPDYVPIHINLSKAYVAQKDFQQAEAILLEGLRRDPNRFRLYNNLGVLYNVLGRYAEAAGSLEKGTAIEPDSAMLHFNLALAYDRLGRQEDAIGHLRRSISLDDTRPDSHFNLGLALYRQGRPRQALQAFVEAFRLDPGDSRTLYNLVMISLELGDAASARDYLSIVQKIDPTMAQKLRRKISQ